MSPTVSGTRGSTAVRRGGDKAELRAIDSFASTTSLSSRSTSKATRRGPRRCRLTIAAPPPGILSRSRRVFLHRAAPPQIQAKVRATRRPARRMGYKVSAFAATIPRRATVGSHGAFHEVIVIAAGTRACLRRILARAGRKVLVLERRERVGGAAMSEESVPGLPLLGLFLRGDLLRPRSIRELELARTGLCRSWPLESTSRPSRTAITPQCRPRQNRRELARHSPRRRRGLRRIRPLLHRMARAVKPLLSTVPPDPLRSTRES